MGGTLGFLELEITIWWPLTKICLQNHFWWSTLILKIFFKSSCHKRRCHILFFLINCKFWILSQILRFWQHWASVLAYQQLAVAVWHLELVCQLPGPAGFWGFTLTKGIYVGRRVWGVKNSRTFGKSFSGKIHWNTENRFPFNKMKAAGWHKNYSLSLWKLGVSWFQCYIAQISKWQMPRVPPCSAAGHQLVYSWLISCQAHFKSWKGLQRWSSLLVSGLLVSRRWTSWGS